MSWPQMTLIEPDCVFCGIATGAVEAQILASRARTVIIEPLEPHVAGHALVIPRTHVPDASTDPVVTGVTFAEATQYASRRWQQWQILTSVGPDATQSVFHLHVHVIPRRKGDGLGDWPWMRPGH